MCSPRFPTSPRHEAEVTDDGKTLLVAFFDRVTGEIVATFGATGHEARRTTLDGLATKAAAFAHLDAADGRTEY
jgi:hypothetical protein